MQKRVVLHFVIGLVLAVMLMQWQLGIQRDLRPFLIFLMLAFVVLLKGKLIKPLMIGLICGVVLVLVQLNLLSVDYLPLNQVTQISGTVLSVSEEKQSAVIRVETLLAHDTLLKERLKVIAYGVSTLAVGDLVVLKGKFDQIEGAVNPYGFDPRQYYGAKGIQSVFYAKPQGLLKQEKGSGVVDGFLNARSRWIQSIKSNAQYGGYWVAFILGEDDGMSEEAIAMIRRTGLAHVLAVSGLHVGIIYGCLTFLALMLFKRRQQRDVMIISMLLLYLVLNLFSFTVLRAVLLLIYHRWSFYQSRRPDVLTAIAVIAGGNILVNPFCLFDLSFCLSLGAVTSITLFYRQLKKGLKPLGEVLSSSLGIIIAAQIGVLPIQLYIFNVFYPESVLFNLLFVPVFSVVIGLAFVLSVFSLVPYLLPLTGGVFDQIMGVVENTIWRTSTLFECPVYCTGFQVTVMIAVGVVGVVLFMALKRQEKATIIACVVAFVVVNSLINYHDFRVLFWSTGKSDAMLIQNAGYTVMIDTAEGKIDLGLLLLKNDISHLDALILTHDHLDHIGGLEAIANKMNIHQIVRSLEGPAELVYDNVHLALDYGEVGMNENDASIIVRLEREAFAMLFMGDAELGREEKYLEKGLSNGVNAIKIGHHGSNTSTGDALVAATTPQVAVILADGSSYFPREEVLERLALCGILVYRTDLSGAIEFSQPGDQIRIKEYLRMDNEL